MKALPLIFLTVFLLASSCKNRNESKSLENGSLPDTETLIRINQQLVKDDVAKNEAYAKRNGWKYSITGNGIIYEILIKNEGAFAKSGDHVEYSYDSKLLDGTFCYSSDSNGVKQFVVDYEEIESGLNDISKILAQGDSARMILPPHLAFGLAGDRNRVPSRSSIVYHLRLLKIY